MDSGVWSATAVISPKNPNSEVAYKGCEDSVPIKVQTRESKTWKSNYWSNLWINKFRGGIESQGGS